MAAFVFVYLIWIRVVGWGGGPGLCLRRDINIARRKQDKHSHGFKDGLFFPAYTKGTLTKAASLIVHSKLIKEFPLVWIMFP